MLVSPYALFGSMCGWMYFAVRRARRELAAAQHDKLASDVTQPVSPNPSSVSPQSPGNQVAP